MKKHFLSVVIIAAMITGMIIPESYDFISGGVLQVEATEENSVVASGKCGKNVTWQFDDSGTITISGVGRMFDYEGLNFLPWRDLINSVVKVVIEEGVTSIGDNAFTSFEKLKEISIPGTVKSIGSSAFADTGLTSVVIPEGVECIKSGAFIFCFSLENIETPESLTSIGDNIFEQTKWLNNYKDEHENEMVILNGILIDGSQASGDVVIPDGVVNIADYAFEFSTSIKSISMPESVRTIGENAFYSCINLNDIALSENIESIGLSAFDKTAWLDSRKKENDLIIENRAVISATGCTGDMVLPDDINCIADSAFYNCNKLTGISIPDSVKRIGTQTFYNCYNLKNINLPSELTVIGKQAFYNCNSITKLGIPDNVKSIGEEAFYKCKKLEKITLPENIESIGSYAFAYCYELENLYIPEYVNQIGENIILDDSKMYKISVSKANPFYCDVNGVLFNVDKTILIAFPKYKEAESYIIPESVTTIDSKAFSCSSIEELIITENVDNISSDAFINSPDLMNFTVSSKNTAFCDINGVLFDKSCKTLLSYPSGRTQKEYNVPINTETLGEYAFYAVDGLFDINLPECIYTIKDYAISKVRCLTDITIPERCSEIYSYGIYNNPNLSKIVFLSKAEKKDYRFVDLKNCTFYGYEGSYAEKLAANENLSFVELESLDSGFHLRGDITFDGVVNSQDLALMINYLLCRDNALARGDIMTADLNNDEKVNIVDLLLLKEILE